MAGDPRDPRILIPFDPVTFRIPAGFFDDVADPETVWRTCANNALSFLQDLADDRFLELVAESPIYGVVDVREFTYYIDDFIWALSPDAPGRPLAYPKELEVRSNEFETVYSLRFSGPRNLSDEELIDRTEWREIRRLARIIVPTLRAWLEETGLLDPSPPGWQEERFNYLQRE